jgi:hypothetical protein
LDLRVSSNSRDRDLLYAGDHSARRGCASRWRRRRVVGNRGDCVVRGIGLVAYTVCPDAIFSAALLPWSRDLADTNLPPDVATGSPVWMARPGCLHWHCDRDWPATRLFLRENISEVDGVRAWRASHSCGCCYVLGNDNSGPRRDAVNRRPGERGSVGTKVVEVAKWHDVERKRKIRRPAMIAFIFSVLTAHSRNYSSI